MRNRFADYIKIARFEHWIKQLFILPGVVVAFVMTSTELDFNLALSVLIALISTGAAASANYVINEWLDVEFDKYHPVKKNRPLVQNPLKARFIIIEYLLFAAVSLFAASFLSRAVLLTEFWLLIMGIIYNVRPLRSKDLPYIDVLSESLNNAIRLLIGWFCVTTVFFPPVSLVVGYWFGGAFLMAAKRFAEYRMIGDKNVAKLYRKSFAHYSEVSLLLSAVFYGFVSVFSCGVFMIKHRVELIIAIPFICGLFCYYLFICYKPDSAAQKPEKLFREKGLMLYVMFLIALMAVLCFVNIPYLIMFTDSQLVNIPGVIK
ncbi:MAG: UbiA prenyltransferase family protein [Oscillospiraceae bacterium]|nr:UbiA prenyltransferase family protein [Oscillospiraceae bacterium]